MTRTSRRAFWIVLVVVGVWLICAVQFSFTPTLRVYATDPTLGAALFTLAQATAKSQQTKDAREQEQANQRSTVSAIENAQRQANATATRQAQLTRQAAEVTATQVSANATATQVSISATVVKQNANATLTVELLRFAQTQVAATTTASAEAMSANATATTMARQQHNEERDATIQSAGMAVALIGLSIVVVLIVAILGVLLIQSVRRQFQPITRGAPNSMPHAPQVVFVQPPPPAIVVDDPAMIEEITRALRASEDESDEHIITLSPTEYDAQ